MDYVILALLGLDVIFTFVLWRLARRPRITSANDGVLDGDEVGMVLAELLEKSRSTGGRVHIHDVEQVIRRRLG